jgi:Zn-dependent protease with chaperone function/uncharacterized tellurite resistance protein B-like protein
MDFFGHQDQARKRTKLLIFLYFLAIASLIIISNVFLAAFMWWSESGFFAESASTVQGNPSLLDVFNHMTAQAWVYTTLIVTSFLGCAYLYKAFALREGGKSIAYSLNARQIHPDGDDFYEKRLLNIVEEMAIASGMPVPPVYIMDEEIGINAFAAGFQPSDAIIGVTKGCLTKLSRKQLQGVIGHEFSHILNGDMRMNMRLTAVLFGILSIAMLGRIMLHAGASSNRKIRTNNDKDSAVPLVGLGLALFVLGYLGVFFGKLIQAAVSRQREYLADASAVQFTRDPSSVGEALKVIGYGGVGSAIGHSKRDEYSHSFFGDAIYHSFTSFSFLSTHPRLEERIVRIDKRWDGEWIEPQTLKQAYDESPELAPKPQVSPDVLLTGVAAAVAATIDFPTTDKGIEPVADTTAANKDPHAFTSGEIVASPNAHERLEKACHDPFSARAVCYTLLLAPENSLVRDQQLELISQYCGSGIEGEVKRLIPAVAEISDALRLPTIEKAIPALKQISADQYTEFKQILVKLVKADGKIDLFEWCIYRLILQYLNPAFGKAKLIKEVHGNPKKVKAEIETVLSFVANHGHDTLEGAQSSFAIGAEMAGFSDLQLQAKTDSLKQFNLALEKLTQAYPHVRGRVVKALAGCVKADGVRIIEQELVQTIAAILESPTPDLFS